MRFARFLRRLSKEESGFSLIELMLVVVIIGILASISFPKFTNVVENAKINADVATGKILKSAVDRYYVDHGIYPVGSGSSASTVVGTLVAGDYLNGSAKYAQHSGGSSSTYPAYFDAIFTISDQGDVKVYTVDPNFTNPLLRWSTNS